MVRMLKKFTVTMPVTMPVTMRLLAVAFLAMVLSALPASAQLRIEVTDGQVAPTPIAIADFTTLGGDVGVVGQQMAEIISNDLLSSGLFDPIDSAAFIAPPKSPAITPKFANWAPLGAKG